MISEVGLVLGGTKKVADILKTLSEALRQKDPDLTAARTYIGDLQQAVYELQSENLDFQSQIVQLNSDKAELKRQIASDEEWKAQVATVEEFVGPGRAIVFRKKGAAVYYCPTCYAKRFLIPLQPGANGIYYCRHCPINNSYQVEPYGSRSNRQVQDSGY